MQRQTAEIAHDAHDDTQRDPASRTHKRGDTDQRPGDSAEMLIQPGVQSPADTEQADKQHDWLADARREVAAEVFGGDPRSADAAADS